MRIFILLISFTCCLSGCVDLQPVNLSPDQRLIASYAGAQVPLGSSAIQTEQKATVLLQLGHADEVFAVAYSPNGKYLASGGADNTVKLWDVESGKEMKTFKGHGSTVMSVAFSPDGRFLVSGGLDNHLIFWDITSGKRIRSILAHYGAVESVVFSPDGRFLLSGGNDSKIELWDVQTGKNLKTYKGHKKSKYGGVSSVAFSPDGRSFVSGADDDTVKIWDMQTGNTLRTLEHYFDVDSVAFSPDGQLVACAGDGHVRLWDVKSGNELRHVDGGSHVKFSRDGSFLAIGTRKHNVKIFDIPRSKVTKILQGHSNWVESIAFSPDGKYVVSGSRDRSLKLWDMQTGKNIKSFKSLARNITSVAFSPDGRNAVSGGWDRSLRLWDVATGKRLKSFKGHSRAISSVAYSPDGRFMVSGSHDKTLKSWNVKSGRLLWNFKGHSKTVNSVAFSPDGRYVASASWDNTVKLWSTTTGKIVNTFLGKSKKSYRETYLKSVVFSPNGRYVAALGGGATVNLIHLWDVKTGKELKSFEYKRLSTPSAISFSSDSRCLAAGYRLFKKPGVICLWDIQKGKVVKTSSSFYSEVTSLAFSPDGKFLTTGHRNNIVRILDLQHGSLDTLHKLRGHVGKVSSVSFSPDGRYVLTGSSDSTMRLWDAASGKEVVLMISLEKDEWLSKTPDNYFASSSNGAKFLSINTGLHVYTIDQLYDQFYRPDIVHARINFAQDKELTILAEVQPKQQLATLLQDGAPTLGFLSPKSGRSNQRHVTFKLSLVDEGGGIGKLVWKINGVSVAVEEAARSIDLTLRPAGSAPKDGTTFVHSKMLTLSPGKNVVEVVAYNKAHTMTSKPASMTLTLKDAISEKPTLYVLAVGINRYRDKSLWLNYAVSDAKDLSAHLKRSALPVFKDVQITHVLDAEATLAGIQTAFGKISAKAKTNDVFILYLAGHGLTLDGRYHFVPVDFRYRNEGSVRQYAINQDHLQNWLATVPARKSLVLLDTCNSGTYVEAQAVMRGMAEKTAMDKLIRATGRTTISASSDTQAALEGIEQHGVFTYALMQALEHADNKHGNRDGTITTAELASFIDEVVPDLTYKKWGYEQVPQVNLHGRPFPIGVSVK